MLWILAAGTLGWTLRLWGRGTVGAGSVVLVANRTLRILHSSKDMALSVIDAAQHFWFIDETRAVIAKPSTVRDAPDAPALVAARGVVELGDVSFAAATRCRDRSRHRSR